MSDIELRPYREGDEDSILDLFPACFGGRTLTRSYWTWRFRDNPLGKTFVELAWAGDNLVAHYATTPTYISSEGQDVLSGLTGTVMTHPDYRGRGLLPSLGNSLYRRMADEGFSLVWAYPTKNSHATFIKRIQWRDVCLIPMLRLQIEDLGSFSPISANVVSNTVLDEKFDEFWQQRLWDNKILVKRDLSHLSWRYERNPVNRYSVITHEYQSRLSGYVIWKVYQETELEVTDLLTVNDRGVGLDLIRAVVDVAAANGMKSVKMWLPFHDPLRIVLEAMGFRAGDPITHFGARSLNQWPGSSRCFDESAWHYALGDSDVY